MLLLCQCHRLYSQITAVYTEYPGLRLSLAWTWTGGGKCSTPTLPQCARIDSPPHLHPLHFDHPPILLHNHVLLELLCDAITEELN